MSDSQPENIHRTLWGNEVPPGTAGGVLNMPFVPLNGTPSPDREVEAAKLLEEVASAITKALAWLLRAAELEDSRRRRVVMLLASKMLQLAADALRDLLP
jgi:hypothetical protein